jgi:hypothetical protein
VSTSAPGTARREFGEQLRVAARITGNSGSNSGIAARNLFAGLPPRLTNAHPSRIIAVDA